MGTFDQNLTVLAWSLPFLIFGALLFWYGWRLDDAFELEGTFSGLELLTVIMRIVGAFMVVVAGIFSAIAFVVLLVLGLSLIWLIVPGVLLGYPLWRVEQHIKAARAERAAYEAKAHF